jgi:AraC-like DNA-binding protein
LKLADLADIACMSPSQFHRLFKKEVGATPFKFLAELRINTAYQKILKEQSSVQEISWQLGCNDYETFSKAFKPYFNLSPDDMKSVAENIKSDLQSDEPHEVVFIPAEEDTSDDENKEKFLGLLKEKGITVEELPAFIAYKVQRIPEVDAKAVAVHKKLEIISLDSGTYSHPGRFVINDFRVSDQ